MAFTFTEFSVSVGATPISLTNGNTTIAANTLNELVAAYVEIDAMAAGDEFEVRLLEKTRGASTQVQRQAWRMPFGENLLETPLFILGNGWDFTILKISGTDRTCQLSLRRVPE
jgi:hypothetical protein